MGIQINGQTDTISAVDGSLSVSGADLTNLSQLTVTGVGTFANLVVTGNVSIAGTLTYEDVTNVDSIGIVTARTGVRIDAGGIVVVGVTTVAAGTAAAPSISPSGDSNTGIFFPSPDTIAFAEGGVESMRIDSSGRVGIGTATAGRTLSVDSSIQISNSTSGWSLGNGLEILHETDGETYFLNRRNANMRFYTNNTERARIDASGRLLVGTSSARNVGVGFQATTGPQLFIEQTSAGLTPATFLLNRNDSNGPRIVIGKSRGTALGSNTIVQSEDELGRFDFAGADGTDLETLAAQIVCQVDGTPGANDMPGRLVFSTTAAGASSPTERMRITNGGSILFGVSTTTTPGFGNTTVGATFEGLPDGRALFVSRNNGIIGNFNRNTNDGVILGFAQDGVEEGTISVSGTTVSYNGAHLSRWSQLPGGAEREEILRGSVLSNLDEMCEWGEEDNEQLNRMKVSDVEGDKNVSGVFQAWDDDDDTYTNDFYCAMTGDFIIRIGPGVTVERGDLLVSAGDGTAKPQDDDIIRSKTIAKVTSINVSCTYEDGSYCVPCVLMAC